MKRNIQLFFLLWRVNLKTLAGFRGDFLLMAASGCLAQVLSIIFIFTLFQNIPAIGEWTFYQVMFMFAIMFIVDGFVSVFFDGIWNITAIVNSGEFDRILLRPVSLVIQIVTLGFGPAGFGNLLIGGIALVISLMHLQESWGWAIIPFLTYTIILGVIIRVSINLAIVCTTFWTKNGNPIMMANHGLSEFAKYPLVIFNQPIQWLLQVIPYAFISFVPASALFQFDSWSKAIYYSPIVAIYCILAAKLIMTRALLKYESVGN